MASIVQTPLFAYRSFLNGGCSCLWVKLAFGKAFGNEDLCQKLPAAVKYDAARKFGSKQR